MDMKLFFKNKRGLSGFITVLIMIIIVIVGVAIIWKVINKTVEENLEGAQTCYEILGKVEFNSEYTCYFDDDEKMQFSINVGDGEVDGLLISISDGESSTSFTITNEFQTIENLEGFGGYTQVKTPGKNSGLTYVASGILNKPVKLDVVPIIDGETCSTGDTFTDIYNCSPD